MSEDLQTTEFRKERTAHKDKEKRSFWNCLLDPDPCDSQEGREYLCASD